MEEQDRVHDKLDRLLRAIDAEYNRLHDIRADVMKGAIKREDIEHLAGMLKRFGVE